MLRFRATADVDTQQNCRLIFSHFQLTHKGFIKMRIVAFTWITTLFIAGCATSPPLPQIETKLGDRIGVFVEVGDSPSHTHIGTTVFNNFTKKYPYKWNLNSDVTDTIKGTLTKAGFTTVDLKAEGIRYSDVAEFIQPSGETWKLTTNKDETVRQLRDQLGLKAFLVLKESRVMTALECSGGPCSERYADASGLYTRSFFGMTRYNAVAAFKWNVFVLGPLADTTKADPLKSMLRIPAVALPEFQDPTNFDILTEAEFSPVRNAILKFTETVSVEATKSLNPR